MRILHIKHRDIDYQQWNRIVTNSNNGCIYAMTWFLDCVSPNWEALVSEDYVFIMPLPVKIKFGIKYIVQPALTQQLGVFSSQTITEKIVLNFIKHIPYLSYEINLNEYNYTRLAYKHTNLMLNLCTSYSLLSRNFSLNTLRNIKKSQKYLLKVDWNLSTEVFLSFLFNEQKKYPLPNKDITQKLVETAFYKKHIQLIGVYDLRGKLLAVLGLLVSGNRIIYLLPSSSREGKEKSAMFFLVNELIKRNAASNIVLDFEGSEIEGVARFYWGFGAKPTSFYTVKRCRPKILIGK